jgi:hypothetical protein
MRAFCVFVTTVACLLSLSACGAGNTTISSLDQRQSKTAAETTGSIATNNQAMARGLADSVDSNKDDLKRGQEISAKPISAWTTLVSS